MEQAPQIGGYLRPHERAAFDAYVQQFRPMRTGILATLLVLRELRCGRLGDLQKRYAAPAGGGRSRLTARPTDATLKQAFEEHVAKFGLDPGPAAGIVFRAELHERWFERAMYLESG